MPPKNISSIELINILYEKSELKNITLTYSHTYDIKIGYDAFKEVINNEKHNYYVEGHIIQNCDFNNFNIIFSNKGNNFDFLIRYLKNCRFHSLTFEDFNFIDGISLEEIKADRIIFKNIQFKYITIQNCDLNQIYFCGENLEGGNIDIDSSSYIEFNCNENINITQFNLENDNISSLKIINGNFSTPNFNIQNSCIQEFKIERCTFNTNLCFSSEEIKHLIFDHSIFNNTIEILEGSNIQHIRSAYSVFNYDLLISIYSNFTRSILCANSNFINLNIQCGYDTDLINLDRLILQGNRGNITCDTGNIANITIGGFNNSHIVLRNIINSNECKFLDLENNNKIIINNITFQKLTIHNSNLNDTIFTRVNFKLIEKFLLSYSNITNITISHSPFLSTNQITLHNDKYHTYTEDETLSMNKENYRQLKIVMGKNEHKDLELLFKSQYFYYLRKTTIGNLDKILLNLNYWSNNYGESWLKGLGFTLSITFIFYWITLLVLSSQEHINIAYQLKLLPSNIQYFFYFLNVTMWKFDFFGKDIKEHSIIFSILFVGRLFIGYGIYQTITAFRKYGKK